MPKKGFQISITDAAERDLDQIWLYLVENASRKIAEDVLASLVERAATLQHFPMRGSQPHELKPLGRDGHRQIVWRTYRILYRIVDDTVFITAITDGRRDMRSFLQQRLLDG